MNRLNKEGHVVEDIQGVRCSIVEKNASPERVEFLKKLLEHNGYTVLTAPTPPPPVKPAPKPVVTPAGTEGLTPSPSSPPPPPVVPSPPSTFTVGVTTISFHPMLAVYERSLFTPEGKPVSIAYWNQEPEKKEELYWERRVK